MLDLLKSTEIVFGLVLTALTAGIGLIGWLGQKMRKAASEAVGEVGARQRQASHKLNNIQAEVQALANRVERVEGRTNTIEKQLATVASAQDLARLENKVSHMDGSLTAEIRALGGMMHSFREAAIRAAEQSR